MDESGINYSNKQLNELLFLNELLSRSINISMGTKIKTTMDRLVEDGKLESNPFDGYNSFEDYWKDNEEKINRRIKNERK